MRLWMLFFVTSVLAPASAAQIAVIAHRGEHRAHPENTLPAFQAAIDAGADFIEADVRTTADGHLVVMHDATVDRTTGGSGGVRRLTLEQIQALDAGAKFEPGFVGTRVPTFGEVLALAHGRTGVYVDAKDIGPSDLIAALTNAGMLESAVIYGGAGYLKRVHALYPSLRVMPEAGTADALAKLIPELKLRVAAFDAVDFQDSIIAVARSAQIAIYVDRLGPADNPSGWQDAVDRGAAGIQTDRPAELIAYLRQHLLHK